MVDEVESKILWHPIIKTVAYLGFQKGGQIFAGH